MKSPTKQAPYSARVMELFPNYFGTFLIKHNFTMKDLDDVGFALFSEYTRILSKPTEEKIVFYVPNDLYHLATRQVPKGLQVFQRSTIQYSKHAFPGIIVGEFPTNSHVQDEDTFTRKPKELLELPNPLENQWTDLLRRYKANTPVSTIIKDIPSLAREYMLITINNKTKQR